MFLRDRLTGLPVPIVLGPQAIRDIESVEHAESCGTVKSHADVDEGETTRILDP